MKKVLLVSGCSFTFEDWNWPGYLGRDYDLKIINVGMGSQGNGLIARKLIYTLDKLLKEYKPEEILVGVMWSGTDRHEFYREEYKNSAYWGGYPEDYVKVKNPTEVIENKPNWYILNHHWPNKESVMYYENFHTIVQGMVLSLEHIIRTQLFLKNAGVDYFMTTYVDIFSDHKLMDNDEVSYLYKNVDFRYFLPVKGCYEWVKENYIKSGFNPPDENNYIGIHPTPFGHEMFSNEVIKPFLNKMGLDLVETIKTDINKRSLI